MKFVQYPECGRGSRVLDGGWVKTCAQKLSGMWEHSMTVTKINADVVYAAHVDDHKVVLCGFHWLQTRLT